MRNIVYSDLKNLTQEIFCFIHFIKIRMIQVDICIFRRIENVPTCYRNYRRMKNVREPDSENETNIM